MLNGIDPIIIFHFSKLTASAQETLEKIPGYTKLVDKIGLPPIPIYLSERLTGLYIDSEDKNIDIETKTEGLADEGETIVTQKPLTSTVRINMKGTRDSIGLTLLSAMADLIVPKVTAQEYSITYLHGGTTIFNGLLHSFAVSQNTEDTLVNVTFEISKTTQKTEEKKKPTDTPLEPDTKAASIDANAAPTEPLKKPIPPPTKKAVKSKGASGSWAETNSLKLP